MYGGGAVCLVTMLCWRLAEDAVCTGVLQIGAYRVSLLCDFFLILSRYCCLASRGGLGHQGLSWPVFLVLLVFCVGRVRGAFFCENGFAMSEAWATLTVEGEVCSTTTRRHA